jgi:hypothetical protein
MAEPRNKEGKLAVNCTRFSCHRFRGNGMRLWMRVIVYNLGKLWRRLALPKKVGNWSLTSLRQRLVKTGGRLAKQARYYRLLPVKGHPTRLRFGSRLRMVAALPLPNGWVANQKRPRTNRLGSIIPWGGMPQSSQAKGHSAQQNREWTRACPAAAAGAV